MCALKIKGTFGCVSASSHAISRSIGCETSAKQKKRVNRSLKKRKPGDMIRIERSGFLHYVIYIGNDKVIDFVADKGGDVSSRDLYETVSNSECEIDNYLDGYRVPYTGEEIVNRAVLAIPKRHVYCIGTYNCEHFATWCRYGIQYCHQPCEVAATLGTIVKSPCKSP